MAQIDSLSIKIEADTSAASNGIDKLEQSLSKLRNAVKGGFGLDALAESFSRLADATGKIDDSRATSVSKLATSIKKLSSIDATNLNTIADGLYSIVTSASQASNDAAMNLTALAQAAAGLKSLNTVRIPDTLPQKIEELYVAVSYITPSQTSNLEQFAQSIQALNQLGSVTIPPELATRLKDVANASTALTGITDFSAFGNLAAALQPLISMSDTGGLGQLINALGRLPRVMGNLTGQVLTGFEAAMQRIATALQPIAALSQQGSVGIQQLITMMQQVVQLGGRIGRTTNNNVSTFLRNSLLMRVITRYMSMASTAVSNWLKNTNSYIEDLNLFTASMGKYADSAQRYAEKVAEVMGIDPAQWMRNQGVFMTLAEGFGVASDRAYIMSKNLTQLGYDLSSFFNITVEDAMTKIQSGLSGELEPLRRLGYDLSMARLKAIALELGITKSFNAMSQAEKSQLRYYAIMTQVTKAQGDMSRTLEAPANQLRILQAQVTQVARALGSIFIPLLNKTLPYIIALAKAVRKLAEQLATVFGFSLPEVDYSGITNIAGAGEEAEESLTGANSAAKKLNETLAGFDELNIIASESGSGSGSGSGLSGVGNDLGFALPEYDFLGGAISDKIDAIEAKLTPFITGLLNNLDLILALAVAVSVAFKLWGKDSNFTSLLGNISKVATAVASVVVTGLLTYHFTNDYLNSDNPADIWPLVKDGLTTALGAYFAFSSMSSLVGETAGLYAAAATIAVSAAVQLGVTAVKVANDGISWETAVTSLFTVLKGAAVGSLISIAAGGSLAAGAAIGATVGIASVAISLGIAAIHYKTNRSQITWGDLTLDGQDIETYVSAHFFSNLNLTATVEGIELVMANKKNAVDSLTGSSTEFMNGMKLITLGLNDAETYKSLVMALTGNESGAGYTADSLLGRLQSAMKETANVIQIGVQTGFISDDTGGQSTIERSNRITETASALVTRAGQELANLYIEGYSGQLDAKKKEMMLSLANFISEITDAVLTGQIQAKMDLMMEIDMTDLTSDSVMNIADQFQQESDAVRSNYRQYVQDFAANLATQSRMATASYNELFRQKAAGEEVADDVLAQAKADADEALAEYNAYVAEAAATVERMTSEALAPAREKFAQEIASVFGAGVNRDDIGTWLGSYGKGKAAANLYDSIMGDPAAGAEYISNQIEYILEKSMSGKDFENLSLISEKSGITLFNFLPEDVKQSIYDTLVTISNGNYGAVNTVLQTMGADLTGIMSTGMTENTDVVTEGIETAVSAAASSASVASAAEYGARWLAALEASMSGNLASSPRQIRKANKGIIHTIPVIKRATGGFPTNGEMFIANEAGPEMIGRIGRRSAVANTSQIVEGISYGVSSANEEQNSLLREQNELLRRLLQKPSNAEISPSVAFGRVVAKSADLYKKAYG